MTHEIYMQRALQLAKLGAGTVAPNPMVGAILVHGNRIIGEGYHMRYGQAHAEVNCINSVSAADEHLVEESIMYVTLEPCAHFGRTPPCADLVIRKRIPRVAIGCRDSFEQVNGKGIGKLLAAGIEVITPVFEQEAVELNRRFFTFHKRRRPYIILKWAQTANGMIGSAEGARLMISSEFTNRRVHQWRSEEAAIMVGTNTALLDDPALTTRLWPGNSPTRLVIDRQLKLPPSLRLFDGAVPTIVFNTVQQVDKEGVNYQLLADQKSLLPQVFEKLHALNIQSVLVEGGRELLQSCIDENFWDEARIITNQELDADRGIPAPSLLNAEKISSENIGSDSIVHYRNISING